MKGTQRQEDVTGDRELGAEKAVETNSLPVALTLCLASSSNCIVSLPKAS